MGKRGGLRAGAQAATGGRVRTGQRRSNTPKPVRNPPHHVHGKDGHEPMPVCVGTLVQKPIVRTGTGAKGMDAIPVALAQ